PHQYQLVPWNLFYPHDIRSAADPPIIWHNETTLAFPEKTVEGDQIQLLDTTTGEKTTFPYKLNDLWNSFITVSPDLTRYIYGGLVDIASGEVMFNIHQPLFDTISYESFNSPQLWSPDSSQFLMYSRKSETDPYYLTLMDRNGKEKTPIAAVDEMSLYQLAGQWSQGSDALYLKWVDTSDGKFPDADYTYITGIAFPQQKHFVDLCLSGQEPYLHVQDQTSLHPNSNQMAFDLRYKDQNWLSIFNWQTGEWYLVKSVRGSLIGWATW
ncbi:MAG TPA: hypothetical protein VHL11_16895, partial [Phototrophicaceae bacterium]|nr:hypothetical protein [Phototrophicaceae bacterium]